ncbi:MAG: hypothetical protein AAF353_09945 [Pseudomonadota bacterium]
MHLILIVLVAMVVVLYLILQTRHDPERRKQFYLYVIIDFWLTAVLLYLLFTGFTS